MFKKVRRNFIIVAMSSITLVLLIVNVVINFVNINRQVADSDQIILAIERSLPQPQNELVDPKIGDSRYFYATYNKETSTVESIVLVHSIIDETTAKNYTRAVIKTNKERGYQDIYRYHVTAISPTISRLVFLNCERSMQNTRHFTMITFYSSLGAMVVCFLIIFFGSKLIMKPIKESYERQNRFITNASHELKTPLAVISANNELIEMKKGSSQYSDNIHKQINRLNIMIKDLTTLSKLNEGYQTKFEYIKLNELLNSHLKQFKTICNKQKLKLTKHIEDVSIIGDKMLVNQIISIILDNARKYSKSKVHIFLGYDKRNIVLKESNDGHLIEEGDLMKYTERFYRGEKSRSSSEGSGIGLSLLEELVNKNNGKLKIYGENKTFNIEIIFSNKNKIK